jgi:Fe-S oxidoreductase
MVSKTYIEAFIPRGKEDQNCINCGICLQKCPVMKMGKEESKAEIQRLLNNEPPQRVLNECTLCFSCNHYCPKGLRPYALIIERMAAKNRESGHGVPDKVKYMFTMKDQPGYFFDLYKAGTDTDKAILDQWSQVPAKSRDTLFIGCFGRSIPQTIEFSKTLASMAKFAPRDACCGEIPYRFGDYSAFSQTVDHTRALLERLDTERLVCYCGSCNNFFGHIWPDFHGVTLPFKVISIWEWLWEKYCSGELKMQRQYSKTVAINDSCYSSVLGQGFFEAVRGLHAAAGMSIVELANNRYDALCCGFAASLRNNYDSSQVAIEAKKRVAQVTAAQVTDVSCYCPGCFASLNNYAQENNYKVHYALSRILWAFGDERPPAKS